MGQRERRRRSTEERNQEIRARLEPLARQERPPALVVATVLAGLIAVANVALWAAGWEVGGREPSAGGAILFAVVMLVCAVAMWQKRYWAVLGFQALLVLSCVVAFLSLLVASNVQGAVLSAAIIVVAGTLFWFLIRVMARLQMPERGDSVRRHG